MIDRGKRPRTRWPAWTVLLLLVAGAARAESPGLILWGGLVVHAGLATELRYDSNVFMVNSRSGDNLPAQAAILRLLPSVDLSSLSLRRGGLTPHNLDFRVHVGLDYREYLSPDPTISAHRGIGVDAGGLLSLFPRGAFNLDTYDNFVRSNQPPYSYNPYNLNRDTNVFGLRFRYSPGGQRLTVSLVYELGYDSFENVDAGPQLSIYNLLYNTVTLRGSWKFLPKTALFVEVNQGFNHYLNPSTDGLSRIDSDPLRGTIGLMGLITQKLALNVSGGYGNGFYKNGPSPSTAVIQGEIKYKPSFLTTLAANYRHDFVNSLLSSYFDLDSVGASYTQLIYRVTIFARFTWERMAFQGTPDMLRQAGICQNGMLGADCVPQADRVDNFFLADIKAEYPVRDWLLPSLGYSFSANDSNGLTHQLNAIVPVSYIKQEGWIRLTVRY